MVDRQIPALDSDPFEPSLERRVRRQVEPALLGAVLEIWLCDPAASIVRSLGTEGGGPAAARRIEDRELFARVALTRGLEFRFGRTDPILVAMLREALDGIGELPPCAIELARGLGLRERLETACFMVVLPSRSPVASISSAPLQNQNVTWPSPP